MKTLLRQLLTSSPYIGEKMKIADACGYPPGHFYSPIPSLGDVSEREDDIFNRDQEVLDIDFRAKEQFDLLLAFKNYLPEMPDFFGEEPGDELRYKLEDETFGYAQYRYGDVIFLYCMMRHFKPSRIIEVGSGFSSAVMLDVNQEFFYNQIQLTFIEPYPQRLYSLLSEKDKRRTAILENFVQEVNTDIFSTLEPGDFLFIDSSHIAKVGSDVNYILFEILPRLPKGVFVHFHDIMYPFEYPKSWIFDNKCFWNESYLLRAFLMNNDSFDVVAFNSFLVNHYEDWFAQEMPRCLIEKDYTGSIWLEKK